MNQEIVEKVVITPKLAVDFLKHNITNRPLSDTWVKLLKNRILSGEWVFNGDSIKFDKFGNLIDGQHRLTAVILAQKEITSFIVKGLDHDAFHTIDEVKKRSASDVVAINGEKNYTIVASCLKLIDFYEKNEHKLVRMGGISTPSNSTVLEILQRHPEVRDVAHFAAVYKSKFKYITPTAVSFCRWVFIQKSEFDTNRFFEFLASGTNLEKGSPILLLRDKLIFNASARAKLANYDLCFFTFKAWNLFRKGKKIKSSNLTAMVDEKFPEAI